MKNGYITPDIIEVKALKNYMLYLKFETGEEKIYDMKPLIENCELYSKLKNEKYFKDVKPMYITVEWTNGEDVAPEYLYNDSISIEEYNKNLQII